MPILLDTNALVWMDLDDPRLSDGAADRIDHERRADQAFICPISYWEVQLAVSRKRMSLSVAIERWRSDHFAAGYIERAVTGIDTMLMAQLPDLHGDPADRLIMAVAINSGLTLLRSDEKILAWPGQLARMDTRGWPLIRRLGTNGQLAAAQPSKRAVGYAISALAASTVLQWPGSGRAPGSQAEAAGSDRHS